MQKFKGTMYIAPLIPAFMISVWSGVKTESFGTPILVFGMWSFAGIMSLLLFGFPMIALIRKFVRIDLWIAVLISLLSAELMSLIISLLIPQLNPWYVMFHSLSRINVPAGVVGGIALWYFGFRKTSE